jgi:hypothetical protein
MYQNLSQELSFTGQLFSPTWNVGPSSLQELLGRPTFGTYDEVETFINDQNFRRSYEDLYALANLYLTLSDVVFDELQFLRLWMYELLVRSLSFHYSSPSNSALATLYAMFNISEREYISPQKQKLVSSVEGHLKDHVQLLTQIVYYANFCFQVHALRVSRERRESKTYKCTITLTPHDFEVLDQELVKQDLSQLLTSNPTLCDEGLLIAMLTCALYECTYISGPEYKFTTPNVTCEVLNTVLSARRNSLNQYRLW